MSGHGGDDERRRRSVVRVNHPILRLDVIGPDGVTRQSSEYHVFCRLQKRSVAMGTCCACSHCDSIVLSEQPAVRCTVSLEDDDLAPDPEGTRTAVGNMLEGGATSIDPSMSLRHAIRLLHEKGVLSLPVVDTENKMVGVVHETGASLYGASVVQVMSASLSIHESVPVRRALELLAAAHIREATVVNDENTPIGIFKDIDGLDWISDARRRTRCV